MKREIEWDEQREELRLFVPDEFSFEENLKYLSRSVNECLFKIKNKQIYKALSVEQETLIIEVSGEHEDYITVRFLGNPSPPQSVRDAVALYVHDWFDLGRDLRPFYDLAKLDPLLDKAVKSFYGLRNMGIPNLFEALCWGILGQQINLTYAYTLKRRLVESFGRCVEYKGEAFWIFPTPESMANLSVSDLDGLRMTVKKCEFLIGIAQLMESGELTKEQLLNTGNAKAAEKMLVKIRGIGPWTANYVLMRCLRFPSAFPIDDVGLHNAIKLQLGMDKKPTKEELLKLSAKWTSWESYATFYLWRFLY
jgi:DNA-3-methyladenine glycosylase II